jgi:hypothetical protein
MKACGLFGAAGRGRLLSQSLTRLLLAAAAEEDLAAREKPSCTLEGKLWVLIDL